MPQRNESTQARSSNSFADLTNNRAWRSELHWRFFPALALSNSAVAKHQSTISHDYRGAIQTKLDCVFVPLKGVIGLFSHGAAFIRIVNLNAS